MASHENVPADEQATQIKFRFCKDCANLLYPLEDRDSRKLLFQCRHCNATEPSETSCVFRNDLTNTVGETAGITQDVGSDPTVRAFSHAPSSTCVFCGEPLYCRDCGGSAEESLMDSNASITATTDVGSAGSHAEMKQDVQPQVVHSSADTEIRMKLPFRPNIGRKSMNEYWDKQRQHGRDLLVWNRTR